MTIIISTGMRYTRYHYIVNQLLIFCTMSTSMRMSLLHFLILFLLFLFFKNNMFLHLLKIRKASIMDAVLKSYFSLLSLPLLNNNKRSFCYMIIQPFYICILHTNAPRTYFHINISHFIRPMYPKHITICTVNI